MGSQSRIACSHPNYHHRQPALVVGATKCTLPAPSLTPSPTPSAASSFCHDPYGPRIATIGPHIDEPIIAATDMAHLAQRNHDIAPQQPRPREQPAWCPDEHPQQQQQQQQQLYVPRMPRHDPRVVIPSNAKPTILHVALEGLVPFTPYPSQSHPLASTNVPSSQLRRLFVGQLPYGVTPMQLSWLCDTIAPGAQMHYMETIIKRTGIKGKRLPTGCIHAYALPEHVDYLIRCLSHRVLFDDTGIWVARNDEQRAHLQQYCAAMKHHEHMRFRDRPYQPVVVQNAVSHHHQQLGSRRCSGGSEAPHHAPQHAHSPALPHDHAWSARHSLYPEQTIHAHWTPCDQY